MNIRKEASVLSAGVPDEEQLAAINAFTKSPLTAGEVYCFSVRLCDDLPDRDFERFDTEALRALAALFRGKTGIIDHDWSAERQIARIFDTDVCRDGAATYLRAWCYMLRTEKNADLIAQIEGGIKKEVSVGCAMGRATCSVCGQEYGTCAHRKGERYDGQVCLAVLRDPVDAYEFSFVAVPAQRGAGVLKAAEGGEAMTLTELVNKNGSPDLRDSLKALEKDALFGRSCRESLVNETVALGLLLDFGAEEEILRKAFSALSGEELTRLKAAMTKKSAELFPPGAILPNATDHPAAMEAAFMI